MSHLLMIGQEGPLLVFGCGCWLGRLLFAWFCLLAPDLSFDPRVYYDASPIDQ